MVLTLKNRPVFDQNVWEKVAKYEDSLVGSTYGTCSYLVVLKQGRKEFYLRATFKNAPKTS